MPAMALPDDFKWRRWVGNDVALTFEGRNIAMVCLLDKGGVRVCLNCGTAELRYVFLEHVAVGVRYVEAWATKWAPQIRGLNASGRGVLFRHYSSGGGGVEPQ